MIQLQLEQCELTYEGVFLKPMFTLMDSPGSVYDVLLDALAAFGCTGADLVLEEGEPVERGVTCTVDELDMQVTIYGDRFEMHCASFARGTTGVAAVLAAVWSGVIKLSRDAKAKTHSFLFEADMEIREGSYQEVLNHLARAPQSFPAGTETAVVFYLPAEPDRGHEESSLVLNRSAEVERGLQINATLVYEAGVLTPTAAMSAAENRLSELLRNVGLQWVED